VIWFLNYARKRHHVFSITINMLFSELGLSVNSFACGQEAEMCGNCRDRCSQSNTEDPETMIKSMVSAIAHRGPMVRASIWITG